MNLKINYINIDMNKLQSFKCAIGLHEYEVYETMDSTDIRGNIVGKIIINRCIHCGKIKYVNIRIVENY